MSCEFTEAIFRDEYLSDDAELLPGGWAIMNQELCRYHDGNDFSVISPEGTELSIERLSDAAFSHYYSVWENTHHFGLPHGKGWGEELHWLIDFVKFFNTVFHEIESFRLRKHR